MAFLKALIARVFRFEGSTKGWLRTAFSKALLPMVSKVPGRTTVPLNPEKVTVPRLTRLAGRIIWEVDSWKAYEPKVVRAVHLLKSTDWVLLNPTKAQLAALCRLVQAEKSSFSTVAFLKALTPIVLRLEGSTRGWLSVVPSKTLLLIVSRVEDSTRFVNVLPTKVEPGMVLLTIVVADMSKELSNVIVFRVWKSVSLMVPVRVKSVTLVLSVPSCWDRVPGVVTSIVLDN